MPFPETSQVVTLTPAGTDQRLLGQFGHVSGLTYSFSCPGGADTLSCTLQVSARDRPEALNPGRIVRVFRGAGSVWDGKLLEPTYGSDGWNITARGSGTLGSDFDAVYTGNWGVSSFDNAVNAAITRGLRWINPGIGSPTGIW